MWIVGEMNRWVMNRHNKTKINLFSIYHNCAKSTLRSTKKEQLCIANIEK